MGLFVGLYVSLLGSGGGAALLVYFLRHFKIITSTTMIAGTMLFISSIPVGIVGLPNFYNNGDINFYIGTFIIAGLITGILLGSIYPNYIDETFGKKLGEKVKNGVTATIYAILTVLYVRSTIYDETL
jgi:uncharacterized membrane protein YfcA